MATVLTRFLMRQYLGSLDNIDSNSYSSDPIFTRFKKIGDKLKDNSIALTNPDSLLPDLNDAFTHWWNLKKQKKSENKISSAIDPKLSDLEKKVEAASSSSAEPSRPNLLPLDRFTFYEPHQKQVSEASSSSAKPSQPNLLPLDRYTFCELQQKQQSEASSSSAEPSQPNLLPHPHPSTSIEDEASDKLERQVIGWVNGFKAVGIYGMGGSGKTALVKNVLKQKTVGDKFNRIIWACLSQLNCEKEIDDWIIKYLLYRLGLDTDSLVGDLDEDMAWLMKELGRRLQESGSYVLVLDDMWHCSKWFANDFLRKLKENGDGAVIVTSRKKTVAEEIGKNRLIQLNHRAYKESAFLKHEDKDLADTSMFL